LFVNLNNPDNNKKMPLLELFDETLDINSTDNYELSLQAGDDEVSFSLLDKIRNKFVMLRSYSPEANKKFTPEMIRDFLNKDDFLLRRYKKANVILPASRSTLVPSPIFDPGKRDLYFTFNHISDENDVIISNKLADPDAFLLFAVSKTVNEIITKSFPGILPQHHLKPLLWYIGHSRKIINGNYLHIHIESDYFNLVIFDKNILKLCNTFNYRNISDILYFVLNVFTKLEIKQEETIYFSGLTERYDDLHSNFSLYIRNVKFAEPAGVFSFSYVFNDTELHRYINLFNAVNCE
jgi:hypothetical protein